MRPEEARTKHAARPLSPEQWRENEAWLYGVDLWNHGFLWEAHEAWESIWRAPFDAEQAEFLRGMIQCAAAGLKIAIGKRKSATKLSQMGLERLERVTLSPTGRYMGLDVHSISDVLRRYIDSNAPRLDALPRIELT